MEVLELIDTWNFDIFQLARVSDGRPLYSLGMAIYRMYNFGATHGVHESTMELFLQKVEAGYRVSQRVVLERRIR